jgi:hypothetical protein
MVGEVSQFKGLDLLKDWHGPAKGCLKSGERYRAIVDIKK